MGLTKHQRLARGIKSLFNALDEFHQKVEKISNVLQFHFYETHLILGRPLMTEQALKAMMYTHRYALRRFSPNEKLREAATSSPLIGMILSPPFYLRSRVCFFPPGTTNVIWHVPWGVKIVLPEENLKKLEETKLEDLLYCASANEMSEWIDWYEKEDKSNTFTNQLCAIYEGYKERQPVINNLNQNAYNFYSKLVNQYLKQDLKIRKRTLERLEFAPNKDTSIAEAYCLVTHSITAGKKRHFMEFQRMWKNHLRNLIFTGLNWDVGKQETLLQELISNESPHQQNSPVSRWKTGYVIDRKTSGAFIHHFADQFLADPLHNEIEGEIVLLLWIMIYVSQNASRAYPLKQLLELKTSNIDPNGLVIEGEEIELSQGLNDLIKEYVGDQSLERQRPLFPNLSMDILPTRFKRASEKLLPPGSTPALPEAFLVFPHPHINVRMAPKYRREQCKTPPPIYYDPISRADLKRQLIEKSSNLLS